MTDETEALEVAARDLLAGMSSTYRARNGREVGIQADDGEKVWLVHSDLITALEAALATRSAPPAEAEGSEVEEVADLMLKFTFGGGLPLELPITGEVETAKEGAQQIIAFLSRRPAPVPEDVRECTNDFCMPEDVGELVEKVRDYLARDDIEAVAPDACELLADTATALQSLARQKADAEARAQKAERERDEALRYATQCAREAGEATGRLEMSEAAGIVEGWKERAAALQAERDSLRERLERLIKASERALGDHFAPNDCYATGPLTGDPFADLIAFPGCELEKEIAAARAFTQDEGAGG